MLGKTTSTEQGWTAVSSSPLTGHTHNPWKHGMTAGGSSSGAAALAGAGCGALHVGTDGAGSIRLPAHFCGAVGHKPTYGLVPYAPTPNNSALSHAGPITRSVADAALMLEVMAGLHPADHVTLPGGFRRDWVGAPDLRGPAHRLQPRPRPCPRRPRGRRRRARRRCPPSRKPARAVEEVTPPWGPKGPELERDLWGCAMLPFLETDPARRAQQDPGLAACLADYRGHDASAEAHAAQGRRFAYAAEIGDGSPRGWDLLVTPAASVAAFPVGRQRPAHWPQHAWDWLVWAEFSYPFDLSHGAGGVGALRAHGGGAADRAADRRAALRRRAGAARRRAPSWRRGPSGPGFAD